MRCIVDGISHRGEGVGHIDGKAVFIPFALPGETVKLKIIEENKSFARARLIDILESSPDRIAPDCPHYYDCGGCAFQHINYHKQLELKGRIIGDSMQRIGKIDCQVRPVQGMDDPWHYRNKVEWHLEQNGSEIRMGYYKYDSHQLVAVNTCKLVSQSMEELGFYIKDKVTGIKTNQKGKITIRESSLDGSLMAILNGLNMKPLLEKEEYPHLQAIYKKTKQGIARIWGSDQFVDQINTTRYNLSPLSFFQVNSIQTRKLYDLVIDYCQPQPGDILLDAFCGAGTIAIYIAPFVKKVIGVENYDPAIKDAKYNASMNQIENCEFISGACEKVIPNLQEKYNAVILDPPRAGCKPGLIQAIVKQRPAKIIYVSCNPSTLARDLALFCKEEYQVVEVQPVDMFPQTHHVETVVLMSRVEK